MESARSFQRDPCPFCGAETRPGDYFCLNCGNRLLPATQFPRQSPAMLILFTDNGEILKEYLLEKLETSIGRAPESDILLSRDKLTSRRHASIQNENGRYMLRDEGSATGTFVNEQRLETMVPRILYDGDRIRIGGHKLLFHMAVDGQGRPGTGNSTVLDREGWGQMVQGQSAVAAPAAAGSNWSVDPAAMTVASSGAEAPTIRGEAPSTPGLSAPPAIEQPGRFILRADNGDILQEYALEKPEVSIGRTPSSDILLSKDKLTSRRHATVRYEEDKYVLYDERSANGTFVNGQQLEEMTPRVLEDGDRVGIGEHELIFRRADEAEESAGVAVLPTIAVPYNVPMALTYRTREDEGLKAAASASENISTKSPVVSPEQLRFTAFYPKEVVVEKWNTLLVYAHVEPALQAIHRDVDKFKNELGNAPRKVSSQATQLIPRGTNITIVPECKGVTFNPKRIAFTWLEDWHRASFRFSVKKELAGSAGNGKINIFAGPLLIGTLKMALLFGEQAGSSQSRGTLNEVTASVYKQIFASYSHDDTPIVLSCRNIYKALGFNVLIDIDTLRAGQVFSEALKRMIDSADIFQLFWSERSAKSAYVALEWEYALRLNKDEGFVRPVYWELPLVPPPAKLAALQFAYLPSYTFTYPSMLKEEMVNNTIKDSPH